jgi:hypothetical protein
VSLGSTLPDKKERQVFPIADARHELDAEQMGQSKHIGIGHMVVYLAVVNGRHQRI